MLWICRYRKGAEVERQRKREKKEYKERKVIRVSKNEKHYNSKNTFRSSNQEFLVSSPPVPTRSAYPLFPDPKDPFHTVPEKNEFRPSWGNI